MNFNILEPQSLAVFLKLLIAIRIVTMLVESKTYDDRVTSIMHLLALIAIVMVAKL